MMKRMVSLFVAALFMAAIVPGFARAEILAMMNYESKTPESLKAFKLTGTQERREGIAIIDVDPDSPDFGKILMDIPLPPDLVAHHIFYDREMKKAYVTALGKSELRVFDLHRFPYRLRRLAMPDCKMGEDVIFSEDNKTWYLTCMMSAKVIVGDVATDKVKRIIKIPNSYPHGLAVMSDIDRILVTSTVSGDLSDPHEFISVVEASTGRVLGKHKMSNKKSPSGVAPVELLRVPGANPPMAYVTNMFGGTLWAATWNPSKKDFDVAEVFDFNPIKAGVPLEMYFNKAADRLYVTTAKPGKFHIFDISADPMKPKLIKTLPAAEGAHHVAITRDGRYGFVQNSLLNLPGMSDGSVTVVDLQAQKVVRSMDTLKNMGLNPNLIVLLPQWNDLAGH
ncbi:MAG: YncE family protein [Rhodospirillales bacterium]